MKRFQIWYSKDPTYHFDKKLTLHNLEDTHVMVRLMEAEDVEDAFFKSQGSMWSPHGEARPLIKSLHLTHTSMSVGDVIIEVDPIDEDHAFNHITNNERGKAYQCDMAGWKEVPWGGVSKVTKGEYALDQALKSLDPDLF